MIVIDSSAIIAIINGEPERDGFIAAIQATDRALMSAVNVHETGLVLRGRFGAGAVTDMFGLLAALDIEVVPFDLLDARIALDAAERYGKGISSVARLNLCDCAAYALAKGLGAPLLFKGDDFPQTDIVAAA